jgi:hypothetical protein
MPFDRGELSKVKFLTASYIATWCPNSGGEICVLNEESPALIIYSDIRFIQLFYMSTHSSSS